MRLLDLLLQAGLGRTPVQPALNRRPFPGKRRRRPRPREVDPDGAEPPFPEALGFGPTSARWLDNGWLETALFPAMAVNPHSP